ncbi:MAG: hypothetical protein H0T84_11665 [Tatlockia sp.]|nr:hypothetical protein [Tatlockia sp.]
MWTKIETVKSLRTKLRKQISKYNLNGIKQLPLIVQENISISPLQHPLEPIIQNSLSPHELSTINFEATEFDLIRQMNESNKFYILENQTNILEQFFLAKRKEDSPLGNLYKELDYSEYLHRLITKKYKAIYADSRLILPREHNAEFARAFQQQLAESQSPREFLERIGTAEDPLIYKEYLSLEEGAISPFIVPQAHFLPLSDGRRVRNSPLLNRLNLQGGNLFEEWDNAHPYPVAISYLAAPEFRNCYSLQYDLLACVRFDKVESDETAYYAKRQALARQQVGFASVISLIYGKENALSTNPNQAETLTFNNATFGKGVFYIKAYKNRLKHNFYQLLQLANLGLMEKGTINIKGMSLGAFAIQELLYPMESIFIETLQEMLAELHLPKIQTVNLTNFPTALNKFPNQDDREYVLALGDRTKKNSINSHGSDIAIYDFIGPPLATQADLNCSTHFCGDSFSYPGNEIHAGVPAKISSDDAVMHFAGAGQAMIKDIESTKQEIKEKTYLLSNNKATLFYSNPSKPEAKTDKPEQTLSFRE